MSQADRVRIHGREQYVIPARKRGERRFSIRAGDVVHALRMNGRVPAVCSALKTHQFLADNGLRLIESTGPKSGLSTTVVFTYEFVEQKTDQQREESAWEGLRGSLKDVLAELGGGEAYLRTERQNFYDSRESK